MNTFVLSKNIFNWSFDNPDKSNTNMIALYFFLIDINNRLGWVGSFGITAKECMSAIGIKSHNTYKKALDELIQNNFVLIVKQSTNQYTANIISLVNIKDINKSTLDSAISNFNEPTRKQQESNKKAHDEPTRKQQESTEHIHKTDILLNYETINTSPETSVSESPKKIKSDFTFKEFKTELLKTDEEKELYNIAHGFYQLFEKNLIEANAPLTNIKKSKVYKSMTDVKHMIEIDKISTQSLRDAYKFLQINDFWKKNVLSTNSLRKHFTKIALEISKNQKHEENRRTHKGATLDEIQSILQQQFGHLPN